MNDDECTNCVGETVNVYDQMKVRGPFSGSSRNIKRVCGISQDVSAQVMGTHFRWLRLLAFASLDLLGSQLQERLGYTGLLMTFDVSFCHN